MDRWMYTSVNASASTSPLSPQHPHPHPHPHLPGRVGLVWFWAVVEMGLALLFLWCMRGADVRSCLLLVHQMVMAVISSHLIYGLASRHLTMRGLALSFLKGKEEILSRARLRPLIVASSSLVSRPRCVATLFCRSLLFPLSCPPASPTMSPPPAPAGW